jgi:hypothetical protein
LTPRVDALASNLADRARNLARATTALANEGDTDAAGPRGRVRSWPALGYQRL